MGVYYDHKETRNNQTTFFPSAWFQYCPLLPVFLSDSQLEYWLSSLRSDLWLKCSGQQGGVVRLVPRTCPLVIPPVLIRRMYCRRTQQHVYEAASFTSDSISNYTSVFKTKAEHTYSNQSATLCSVPVWQIILPELCLVIRVPSGA